jgi:predicted exporter
MPTITATTNYGITMPINRVSCLTAAVVALVISGCASKPVDPAMSASQAADNAPPPDLSPSNPDDIMALGVRLTQNRLSLFSVSRGKYTFYVGGTLEATYETATRILRISSLTHEDKIEQTCEYSPQGVLFIDPKETNKDAFVNSCNRLALSLNDYMSR